MSIREYPCDTIDHKNIPNRLAVWIFLSTFVAVFALEYAAQDILTLNSRPNLHLEKDIEQDMNQ